MFTVEKTTNGWTIFHGSTPIQEFKTREEAERVAMYWTEKNTPKV